LFQLADVQGRLRPQILDLRLALAQLDDAREQIEDLQQRAEPRRPN
jgi:uncharacterized protein YhaN